VFTSYLSPAAPQGKFSSQRRNYSAIWSQLLERRAQLQVRGAAGEACKVPTRGGR
jgi:hypothetical protein